MWILFVGLGNNVELINSLNGLINRSDFSIPYVLAKFVMTPHLFKNMKT